MARQNIHREGCGVTVPDRFGFYAILTDPVRGYEYMTSMLAANGVRFVQLRMKGAPEEQILEITRGLARITRDTQTCLIINDYPFLARRAGADGVHVGQRDMPCRRARDVVGEDAIVGISTHTPRQAEDACALRPDYIGVGPVHATPTKTDPDPVIGLDGMRRMLDIATVPAVAIGGITPGNLPEVLAAGARNFCMVRPLCQSRGPEKVLKKVLRRWEEEIGGQKPEARSQKPEARSQKPEARSQKSEAPSGTELNRIPRRPASRRYGGTEAGMSNVEYRTAEVKREEGKGKNFACHSGLSGSGK